MERVFTVSITREQNNKIRELIISEATAYKNWICTAVEAGDLARAQKLTAELRGLEKMYHIFVPDSMLGK